MRGINRNEQCLQQDGTTPHTSNESLGFIRGKFGERLISFRADNIWPPHSPDLNPPDFYLWGYLKDHVYANRPTTLDELKDSIVREIRAISQETCVRVFDNFLKRIRLCRERIGGHLEHVIR